MAVNNVNQQYNYVSTTNYKKAAEAKEKTKNEKTEETSASETAKSTQKSETYKPNMDMIEAAKADMKGNIGAYKQMVFGQFKSQAGSSDSTLKSMLNKILDLTPEEAAANISEDGEWGVEATANRILDFAKSLAGDDPSKLETLKEAVKKGFGAAEKVWGGKLPDISYQTLQKVMDGFDEWEKSFQVS